MFSLYHLFQLSFPVELEDRILIWIVLVPGRCLLVSLPESRGSKVSLVVRFLPMSSPQEPKAHR